MDVSTPLRTIYLDRHHTVELVSFEAGAPDGHGGALATAGMRVHIRPPSSADRDIRLVLEGADLERATAVAARWVDISLTPSPPAGCSGCTPSTTAVQTAELQLQVESLTQQHAATAAELEKQADRVEAVADTLDCLMSEVTERAVEVKTQADAWHEAELRAAMQDEVERRVRDDGAHAAVQWVMYGTTTTERERDGALDDHNSGLLDDLDRG